MDSPAAIVGVSADEATYFKIVSISRRYNTVLVAWDGVRVTFGPQNYEQLEEIMLALKTIFPANPDRSEVRELPIYEGDDRDQT